MSNKYTNTNENWWAKKKKVLSKFTFLFWATVIAILGCMKPVSMGETPLGRPKFLSPFFVDVGTIDSDICHFVSPGPIPILFQTFRSEFTAICIPPDPFPRKKSNKLKSFNNGLCYSLSKVQSFHSSVKIWRRFLLDSPAILYQQFPHVVTLWQSTQSSFSQVA